MTGIEIITQERERQVNEEGFDSNRDDQYTDGQLAEAAACYAACSNVYVKGMGYDLTVGRTYRWPWDVSWWKPGARPTVDERIKELAKAGALIAAEIDRLKRTDY
jgi:hypothetical protein